MLALKCKFQCCSCGSDRERIIPAPNIKVLEAGLSVPMRCNCGKKNSVGLVGFEQTELSETNKTREIVD